LPFIKAQAEAASPLFRLTNTAATGILGAIDGLSNSTDGNAVALKGTITSITPGGFSSAIRGLNNGTGGLGIGVWGSQAGSGWGVYGNTPNGIGVYGNSSAAGIGVFGLSTDGAGVSGASTNGVAGSFSITNNTNASNVLEASTLGDGAAINGSTSSTTSNVSAVRGEVFPTAPGGFSAGVRGINNGTGGLGIGVWGSQAGSGWGVYGVTPTGLGVYGNSTGAGTGVFANSASGTGLSATSNTGSAASFNITNNANSSNTVEVNTLGNGHGILSQSTSGTALEGITNSISAAGVIGRNQNGEAIVGFSSGAAGVSAVVGRSDGAGIGIRGFNIKDGIGVLGQAGISGGTGIAARFENVNTANASETVDVNNNGTGNGISVNLSNVANGARGITVNHSGVGPGIVATSEGGTGLWGIASSISAAGVIGDNTTGEAIVGRSSGGNGVGAVVGRNDNAGYGVRGFNTKDGIGVFGQAGLSGGTGKAARFENVNAANGSNTLEVATNGTGNLAVFIKGGNVARIDNAGRGFFNGGTQNNGADLAEAFEVTGNHLDYEPGDILAISKDKDRTVQKSTGAYSSLVAGVYATKPGVLLTEEHIESNLDGLVPMGVVGVIPTKVCLEGGPISRGDLLVTSSIPGVAMKADPDKIKFGMALGKALEPFNDDTVSKIKVLVNVK
jgi:hypothetical protein